MNIRAIIIEDEEPARELLKNFLKQYPDIELVGEYLDGFEGAKAINQHKPDLVFLDIQLPRITGMELLELLDYLPMIIFTTAYDEFALKAFEKNAVDYLLKPFSRDRFGQGIAKVREKFEKKSIAQPSIQELADNLTSGTQLTRIVVKTNKAINVLSLDKVMYFEAQDDYVMIYTIDGRYMKKQTMKYFEDRLDPEQFIRIHRSYIANTSYLNKLEPYEKDNYLLVLKNGVKLKVSNTGYKTLKDKLDF